MARPRSPQPTDVELEILKTLWESGPAELAVVCAGIRRRRPVATTTVATLLGVMLEKGLVRRTQGPRAYVWEAVASRETTASGMLRGLMERIFEGSARRLVAHLLSSGPVTASERKQILDLLHDSPNPRQRSGRKRSKS
jgi:predicted transcriptional regulator